MTPPFLIITKLEYKAALEGFQVNTMKFGIRLLSNTFRNKTLEGKW